jgi:cold shock CspA family protein
MSELKTGTCVAFDEDACCGLIKRANWTSPLAFHISSVVGETIEIGQSVSYEVVNGSLVIRITQ